MNSLNILSAIGPTPASPSSSLSSSDATNEETDMLSFSSSAAVRSERDDDSITLDGGETSMEAGEQSVLLGGETQPELFGEVKLGNNWHSLPKRISSALIGTIRVIIATFAAPGRYLIACFYDEQGRFSPLLPIIAISRNFRPRKRRRSVQPANVSEKSDDTGRHSGERGNSGSSKSKPQKRWTKRSSSVVSSSSTAVASDSEFDEKLALLKTETDSQHRSTRSRSSLSAEGEEIAPARRSIRIKLHNEETLKRRRKQHPLPEHSTSAGGGGGGSKEDAKEVVAAHLKSPSSPGASKITKFPRAPFPPRPLIPRRLPSYTKAPSNAPRQKTLIIDLDETLIHSHSKGGRFTTGHMVEVKMGHSVGVGGVVIGPQVPILYYVHKRPHCDEFLRMVHKWYNLVIFTASVQEYADPVIDWLELERSYFSARYYRQHCTHRNGAYIKDLSQVEPDLSRVMIVDNSPVSYIFHEDNAIPIEGWISDPTDNDLLNLIPLLEGLAYATDVRALLALRLGQPQIEGA